MADRLSQKEVLRALRQAREGFRRVKSSTSIEFPADLVRKIREADERKRGKVCEKEDCDLQPLAGCSC